MSFGSDVCRRIHSAIVPAQDYPPHARGTNPLPAGFQYPPHPPHAPITEKICVWEIKKLPIFDSL